MNTKAIYSVPFSLNDDTVEFIVQAQDLSACSTPSNCIRPAGLAFDKYGRLFVSSDSSGEVSFLCLFQILDCADLPIRFLLFKGQNKSERTGFISSNTWCIHGT